MPNYSKDLTGVAHTLGYESGREMLLTLYVVKQQSLAEISKLTGFSVGMIRRNLLHSNITMRPRGGFKPRHIYGSEKDTTQ